MDPADIKRRKVVGKVGGAAKHPAKLTIAPQEVAKPLRNIARKRLAHAWSVEGAKNRLRQLEAIRAKGKGLKGAR